MQNRRRNYFINKRYQGRFIALFLGTFIVGIVLTLSVMLHYIYQRIQQNIFQVHMKAAGTGEIILPVAVKVNVLFFALGVLVIGFIALYYSRKMDRLVDGIMDGLRRMREGELDFEMKIGQHHEFPGLERGMNEIIENNRHRMARLKTLAGEIDAELQSLGKTGREDAARFKARAAVLNKKIDDFRKAVKEFGIGQPG